MRKNLILFLCWLILWSGPAWSICAIDGKNTAEIAQNNFSAAPSTTISLTTSSPNDVVLIHSTANVRALDAVSVNSISGGLVWNLRFKETQAVPNCRGTGNPCYFDVETWWAVAPSPLSGTTFTILYNAPAQATFVNIFAFGVSGLANPSAPWDSNSSLPAKATNYGGAKTPIEVSGVSTTNANDFMLYSCFANLATGGAIGSNCSWAGAAGQLQPWSNIQVLYQQNIFTGFFDNSGIWDLSVITPFSGATLSAQDPTAAIQNNWIASADALVCVGSAPPSAALPHVWIHE